MRVKAEKARRRLHEFVVQAWHVLEPDTPFVDGVHVLAICDHLQAVTEVRIRNLIINVPPGHAKSLLTAVLWPAVGGRQENAADRDRCGPRVVGFYLGHRG